MKHIAFAIDEKKKIKFKSLCVQNEDDMSKILRDAVDAYISSKRERTIVKS